MFFRLCQRKHPFRLFLLSILLISAIVSAATDDDIEDLDEDEDEDEKEREPIARRQLTAMRDTIKSVAGNSVKLLTNARLVKGVANFVQKAPSATGSAVVNVYQAMRSHWLKQTSSVQKALIKQLQGLTKRLSNSRLLIGNIGAKLSNREESATKNTRADDVVAPTSEPKQELADKKTSAKTGNGRNRSNSKHNNMNNNMQQQGNQLNAGSAAGLPFPPPIPYMHPLQAIPSAHVYARPDTQYFAPPPVQAVDPMIVDPMYGSW